MQYIEPHIHMVCRVTDDYEDMARWGCVAVSEPAFWAGFDRGGPENFRDYFRQLTEFEPKRAAKFGIRHFCWLCINPKEAENVSLARDVLSFIPEFLDCPTVLGIGEIGLNKNTKNECVVFEEHLELAAKTNSLVLIHTPHLQDKYKGTRMILDMLRNRSDLPPERVLIDHCEEHTIGPAYEAGYWCGLTLYPVTKCTPQRAVDVVERFGLERILVNSAADWGPSTPRAVPDFVVEMRRRGFNEEEIRRVVFDNPAAFFRQSGRFDL